LKISAKISSKLAQKHSSLVLNKEYEQSFVSKGEQAIRSSDGRATLRRANHFYSYGKLAEYSHYNFTGIFGSELLRPISAIGHTFNKNFLKMLLSANPEQAIKDIINDLNGKRYLNQRYLLTVQNEVIDDVLNYFRDLKKDLPIHLVLYIFHLQEGFRKYFGHEIHGTRFFVTTYSPYIDDEFIRFILSTPVLSLNKKAIELNFKKDMWNIRLGQLLYIPIIKTNYPALMNFITGRFCTPAQLASRFFPLSIAPAMIPYKLNRMFSSFGTENWINLFIDKHRNLSKLDSDLFVPLAPYDKSAFEDYAKQMSLRYWLNHVS